MLSCLRVRVPLVVTVLVLAIGCHSSSDSLVDDDPGGGVGTTPPEGDAGGSSSSGEPPRCPSTAGRVEGAASLNVRAEPSSDSAAQGKVQAGAVLAIYCQADGEDVDGNAAWDYLGRDLGYVADRYVTRDGEPPPCTAMLRECGAAVEEPPPSGTDAPPSPLGSSPPVEITGPAVQAHVQDFANDVCAVTGACTIGTYSGHSPSADLALDILISDEYGELPTDDDALGDRVAAYALANQAAYRIEYVIFRQRIDMGDGWDAMEDRGSITENHLDHVHVTFEP